MYPWPVTLTVSVSSTPHECCNIIASISYLMSGEEDCIILPAVSFDDDDAHFPRQTTIYAGFVLQSLLLFL